MCLYAMPKTCTTLSPNLDVSNIDAISCRDYNQSNLDTTHCKETSLCVVGIMCFVMLFNHEGPGGV